MGGFQKFLASRTMWWTLRIAVVIGAAFGDVVKALVRDFITPLLGVFGGVPDFSALFFTVNNSRFLIGDFINVLLSFLALAFVVYYFVVVPVNRLVDRFKPDEPDPSRTRECPHCLSKIPRAAAVCAFCTREVPATV